MAQKTDVQLKNEWVSGATITKGICDDLIDSKVNKGDIVNDLVTGGVGVPLSAEQGAILDQKTASDIFTNGTGETIQDVLDPLNYKLVVGMSVDQTISTGVHTLIDFDTVIKDPMGWFDNTPGNYKYTPQVAGLYKVTLHTSSTLITTPGAQGHSHIYLNGVSMAQCNVGGLGVGVGNYGMGVTFIVSCNGTTDYIQGFHYLDTDTGIDGARTQMIIEAWG